MHIKKGFKSYKDYTAIEPLSPHHNVVVGRNGSGKSNFFAAIRFVLSDAYTHLSREERQALLHEGPGSTVLSAYVEITFDNEDNRFPTGKPDVILRRTIGMKKDEYSLDRKTVTKTEVINLLESAGFSRSNPYYIVPQGRVTSLTNAKDSERLALLKEVAGTQVYDQRRAESLKIMDETKLKAEKIDELLSYIEERLDELGEEKNELNEFYRKDNERRCLEYTIYSRENEEITNALETLEQDHTNAQQQTDANAKKFMDRERRLEELRAEVVELKHALSLHELEKGQLEEEYSSCVQSHAAMQSDRDQLSQALEGSSHEREDKQKALASLVKLIDEKEQQLSNILPVFEQLLSKETEVRAHLHSLESETRLLSDKRGRGTQFNSNEERDAWLNNQISILDADLKEQEASGDFVRKEIDDVDANIRNKKAREAELMDLLQTRQDVFSQISSNLSEEQENRDDLLDQRKEAWRNESKLKSLINTAQNDMLKAEQKLLSTMDRHMANGLRAVAEIAKRLKIEGYFGPLCELFTVDDRFKVAVEATAGNSLFHIVVDSDETASNILEVMYKENAGRVTFMPLNKLHPKPVNYPEASDALPLVKRLKFDAKFEPAFMQVFGKTVVCPSLDVASQYARSHHLNGVTLNGDRSDKRGALTGGYRDFRNSRLESLDSVNKCRTIHENYVQQLRQVEIDIARLDQEITACIDAIQKKEVAFQQHSVDFEPLRNEESTLAREIVELQALKDKKGQMLDAIQTECLKMKRQRDGFLEELKSPFQNVLSKEEQLSLATKLKELGEVKPLYEDLNKKRIELEEKKIAIETELHTNLYLRRKTLEESVNLITRSNESGEMKRKLSALQKLKTRIASLEEQNEALTQRIQGVKANLDDVQSKIQKLEDTQKETAQSIERDTKLTERTAAKKSLLLARQKECNDNIRTLGVLPDDAYEKYASSSSNAVVKKYHKVCADLKSFGHVNKKAFEQYTSFTKQRDSLTQRRDELKRSQESIQELTVVLDQRKDEAIERTFKQVAKNFSEIFEKLVPAGRGQLVMKRRINLEQKASQGDDDMDVDDSSVTGASLFSQPNSSVDNYTGVSISVSFNSKDDEQLNIQQLSGGQKSLCALTLIFAIQRCDPAPFNILDECDANLDAQYRTAIAAMVKELSQTSQFICTTFRPEMIKQADSFFGVLFNHKVSSVQPITREEAANFVEG
ncbi:mitotic cohesin complex subunit Psm3 [Schizosaccharomyces japonicus yFS275]|uniref:Structural maintenance of chromosomes protein n=1 Tax=Schizosaccharomyces japonicus (strain yFS275 / FY16936) TaxID=402676 RepID=B6K8E1_SCHJY|nr:mitotic cohesin complex subunit Psm3 [Schizosaccharomyces japonicus yFS275]EEB09795.1 mitotic cohesin complex subunit Psm3 [Schizosaccharomyces japonicus yFS275]